MLYNLYVSTEFARFDMLRAELEKEMRCAGSADLDLLVSAHKNSLALHQQCQEILQAATEYIEGLDAKPSKTEWQGFKQARTQIELLDRELSSAQTLAEVVTKYTEICQLIAQYQMQLDIAQNTIVQAEQT